MGWLLELADALADDVRAHEVEHDPGGHLHLELLSELVVGHVLDAANFLGIPIGS
jgi:hypothetical protein